LRASANPCRGLKRVRMAFITEAAAA